MKKKSMMVSFKLFFFSSHQSKIQRKSVYITEKQHALIGEAATRDLFKFLMNK